MSNSAVASTPVSPGPAADSERVRMFEQKQKVFVPFSYDLGLERPLQCQAVGITHAAKTANL